MQPKPMAETSGPFFPSGRSCITLSSITAFCWMKTSRLRMLSHLQNSILRYNKVVFGVRSSVKLQICGMRAYRAGKRMQETNKFRYIFAIALSLLASVTSGAIFLLALLHQFALVEVAASLTTALQVYSLSSAIADRLEKAKRPRNRRNSLVILFTVFLVAFYFFTQYSR